MNTRWSRPAASVGAGWCWWLTAALACAAGLGFHVGGALAAVLGSLIVAGAGWVIRSG